MSDRISDMSLDNDTVPEVVRVLKALRLERARYFKNKILCDALSNCELKSNLRKKVDSVLISHKLEKCVFLDSACPPLIKLPSSNTLELSYEENNEVQESVEKSIVHTKNAVVKALEPFSKISLSSLTMKKQMEQDFIRNLHNQQQKYVDNLSSLLEILDKLCVLRTEKVQKISNLKTEEAVCKDKMYTQREQLLELKTKVKVFTETPETLPAFQIALADICNMQKEYLHKIKELSLLKQKYEEVKCAEFDEIVQKCINLKKSIQMLEKIYKLPIA